MPGLINFRYRLSIIVAVCFADLLTRPENKEAVIGSNVSFTCRTSLNYSVYWNHVPVGAQTPREVYYDQHIIHPYNERVKIEINKKSGDYVLVITSVRLEDAGRYECIEKAGHGQKSGAELIVLATRPVCESDIRLVEVIGKNDCGIDPDKIQFRCTLKYSGNIRPTLHWKNTRGDPLIPFTETIERYVDQITYTAVMVPDENLNGMSYVCHTRLSNYTWSSDTVRVLYVLKEEKEVSVRQSGEHRCSIKSSQPCSYRWVKLTGDTMENMDCDDSCLIESPGKYRCQANCTLGHYNTCVTQPLLVNFEGSGKSPQIASTYAAWIVVGILFVLFISVLVFISIIFVRWIRRNNYTLAGFSNGRLLNMPKGFQRREINI